MTRIMITCLTLLVASVSAASVPPNPHWYRSTFTAIDNGGAVLSGSGTVTPVGEPALDLLPVTNAVSVSGDYYGVGVLLNDGTPVMFPAALFPELADVPIALPPLRQLTVEDGVAMGIDRSGTLHMWGRSEHPPFGNPGSLNVPQDLGPVLMASQRTGHTVALTVDGTVRAWGLNNTGQCNVPPGLANVIKVSAGKYHSAALTADGQIVTWGSSPQAPPGTYVDVAAGHYHSLAVRSDGALVHIGSNIEGVASMPSDLGWTQIFDDYAIRGGQRCDGVIVSWGGSYAHPPGLHALTYACDCDDAIDCFGDCNGDGLADFFQIMNGELADTDLSGIPDVCEFADCDQNGISDADEIAAGVPDCNQNGIPDNCDYEGLYVTPQQAPFGAGNGLSHTFTDVDFATEDVSLVVEVRGDFGSTAEFATLKIDGETIDVLWALDGEDCPGDAQIAEYIIPADEFNALAKDGQVTITLEASPLVSATECPDSYARVTIQYATTFPDCNGNGLDDNCELADGMLADCDGNGVPDTCDGGFPDCNANGIPDSCDIADGTLADCNGNGQPDSCEVASWPDLDCDGDGQLDECQIAGNAALDENEDGILDTCSFALGDFDLDGMVGGSDLAFLLALWGAKNPPVGDLTGDGMIDGADLASLLGNWGPYQGVWGSIIELLPDPEVVTDPEWRERIIATGLPWRVRDNASQIEMLLVPPGTFMMGCSPSLEYGCNADENPVHEVTLTQAFYLGRYEVTQAQWTAISGQNPSCYQYSSDSPNRPVERTSWNMIQSFLAATSLRLPTEAEWEYACRGGAATAFNNGTDDDVTVDMLGWISDNASGETHVVGQKQANTIGLFDMHGNVREWVSDWRGEYDAKPQMDPAGPSSGEVRVVRGGGWANPSNHARSSHRDNGDPSAFSCSAGFRVARTP